MRRSSQLDFTVYEFNDEDEAVESASGRFTSRLGKTGNPMAEESAVSKLTFYRAFAEGKVVDEDMTGKIRRCFPTVEQTCVMDEISVSAANYNMPDISQDMIEAQGLVPQCVQEDTPRMEASSPVAPDSDDEQSNHAFSDKKSNGTQVSVSSEDDDSSASSPDYADHEGSLEYPTSADCWTGFRGAEDTDMRVIVLAEYVMYGSELYAESRLFFFSDCVKIECSDESGKEFTSEWGITDIIHISCQWSQSVGTAWVKVCLKPSIGSTRLGGVHDASVVVRFCVPDFRWSEKEQKIMLLAPRYKDIFNSVSDPKLVEEEDEILGPKPYISRHYLIDFKESCEEVIYPKGDPDAVCISSRDLDLLQPETFVNDTIIDFYIKHLIDKIRPKEKHRFHFFNSFFFRKLVDLDKDPSSAAEGRAAFLRVRKWTRKVNIFEKDYLFIPVNFNLHWSLLVICHPGEVAHVKEELIHEVCRIPCILHMDSMKGSHTGLKDLVQSYLWEEWKERHQESLSSSNFSDLRFIPLELPQQQNSFDCGLFLLHYVELFLKEAPANFNPFTIKKFSNFLNKDWFVPDEASHKRFVIRNLICDLLNDCQKGPQSSCGNWHYSEASQRNAEKESVEFLTTTSNLMKTDNISTCSSVHDVADTKISTLASRDHIRYDKEAGLLLHNFFDSKATRKISSDSGRHILLQNNSFHNIRSTMSPIEEEPSEHFVLTPQESSHPLTDILNAGMVGTSCGLKDDGTLDTPQKQETSLEVERHGNGDSSPDATSCSSINSFEHNAAKMDAGDSLPDQTIDDVPHQGDETEKERSSPGYCEEVPDSPLSVSREVSYTCVVEDSQEADNTMSGNVDCDTSSASCREAAGSCQEMGLTNGEEPSDEENVQRGGEKSVPLPGMQRHKRRKVMHGGECNRA